MSFWISGWGTQGRCRYSAVSLITRFDFMAPITRVITALQCTVVLFNGLTTVYGSPLSDKVIISNSEELTDC